MMKLEAILKNACHSVASFFILVFIISTMAMQAVDAWSAEPIRVGIFQNKPLVYYEDGPQGLFVEILNHIAKKEDWNLQYVPCELQQCLDLLKANKLDIMTALGKTRERSSYLSYSKEPVWTIWGTIYAQDEKVDGIFDLTDKRIGVIKGSRITAALQEMLTEFNIPVQYAAFENYDSLYKAFEAKKLDAFSMNNSYGFTQKRDIHPYKTPIVFSPFSVYFAAPINGRQTGQLAIINKYVKELKADKHSLFYTFKTNWFGDNQAYWTGRRIGILSAIFIFFTICFMAFWRYRSLLSINKELTRNIKERKQAERNLRFTKFSIDHIADSVFWIDKDGRLAYANESACRNLGYSQQELLAMSVEDIDPYFPAAKWPEHWRELQEKGAFLLKTQHLTKDRKLIPVEVVANYMAFEDMEYNCAVARDLTDRIKAEEKHAKMEAQLHQAQKMEAIGTLAGGIAHDFNNILAAILGYADLANDEIPEKNPAKNYIDQILKAGNRAKELVSQILLFSRKGPETQQILHPSVIMKEGLKLLRASLPTTIEIHEDIDPECGAIVANPTNIHQVLVNLCTNALHAMAEEKGVLTVKLTRVQLNEDGGASRPGVLTSPYIELLVSDTGHGMGPKTMERIYEPFFTTKGVGQGSGMGLALVHSIVHGCGGFIKVESETGKGSTFRVYFPVTKEEPANTPEEMQLETLPEGYERILAVDDEKAIVGMFKASLEKQGYKVTAHCISEKVLEEFRRSPDSFDLLITDQTMPNLSGSELAREILQIRPDIPIILCTGYSSVISEEMAKQIGIAKFLMKPVSRRDLAITVREVLDTSRAKN